VYLSTLNEWLTWISNIHYKEIDFGLERVKLVADRLDIISANCPVIIVGGTNGKGSTVAGLESIYRAAGFHVGTFTSPIIFKHNEYVRIDGITATDEAFCDAYAKIEIARGEITLTPFEYHTLAALLIFKSHQLDVMILEVGLGGRLDAVNILDADVAVVTSVSIDHVDYLGSTREEIGFEKAGIFRRDKPAVCGDKHPPASLINYADQIGAKLFCQGKDFNYVENLFHWSWQSNQLIYDELPRNALDCQNLSNVLMVITLLQDRLPVTRAAIDEGLNKVKLTGRIQIIPGAITEIYDVSHNPAAMELLKKRLKELPCDGKTLAVFSMLGDKDILNSIKNIAEEIDAWFVAPLNTSRSASKEQLVEIFSQATIVNATFFSSIHEAYFAAKAYANSGDRIIIFGSFHTVAEVMEK